MGNLMGRQRPLKEVLREQKRTLNKAIRELEREIAQLQQAEKKLTSDIKKAAKENQMVRVDGVGMCGRGCGGRDC